MSKLFFLTLLATSHGFVVERERRAETNVESNPSQLALELLNFTNNLVDEFFDPSIEGFPGKLKNIENEDDIDLDNLMAVKKKETVKITTTPETMTTKISTTIISTTVNTTISKNATIEMIEEIINENLPVAGGTSANSSTTEKIPVTTEKDFFVVYENDVESIENQTTLQATQKTTTEEVTTKTDPATQPAETTGGINPTTQSIIRLPIENTQVTETTQFATTNETFDYVFVPVEPYEPVSNETESKNSTDTVVLARDSTTTISTPLVAEMTTSMKTKTIKSDDKKEKEEKGQKKNKYASLAVVLFLLFCI